jgi:hypothetical protein
MNQIQEDLFVSAVQDLLVHLGEIEATPRLSFQELYLLIYEYIENESDN